MKADPVLVANITSSLIPLDFIRLVVFIVPSRSYFPAFFGTPCPIEQYNAPTLSLQPPLHIHP